MPIYAYKCSSCGAAKDALQKMSDAPLTQCPACGRDSLVKLVTAAGFQLKGSGWYATDFKKDGGSAAVSTPASGADSTSASTAADSTAAAPAACGTGCACH